MDLREGLRDLRNPNRKDMGLDWGPLGLSQEVPLPRNFWIEIKLVNL